MTLDDLPLEHSGPSTPPPEPPASRTSITRWAVVIVAAMAAGALLMFWWMSRSQVDPATPAPTMATEMPTGSNRPSPQPLNLPDLANSDRMLREMVSVLSRHPMLVRLLATDELIRSAVLAVVQIGDGKTPATPLSVLRPTERLQVQGTPTGPIDPASFARWNSAISALVSIDPAECAQLYVDVKPLFDEAYAELGQPDGNFDDAVVLAIQTLAATPEPESEPILIRRPGYFEHESVALRSLLPVQKQFLLIGPTNRHQVLAWLRQVAGNLDLRIE